MVRRLSHLHHAVFVHLAVDMDIDFRCLGSSMVNSFTPLAKMTKLLPENILKRMSAADRKAIKQTTAEEAGAKYNLKLEREDHRTFSKWCSLNQIYYLWSRTDKAVTIQVGHPDFSLFYRGLTLFIEFKRSGQKLSKEQEIAKDRLTKQHFDFSVCYSAEEAIKVAKRFFAL